LRVILTLINFTVVEAAPQRSQKGTITKSTIMTSITQKSIHIVMRNIIMMRGVMINIAEAVDLQNMIIKNHEAAEKIGLTPDLGLAHHLKDAAMKENHIDTNLARRRRNEKNISDS
jgi:hypothetical protein